LLMEGARVRVRVWGREFRWGRGHGDRSDRSRVMDSAGRGRVYAKHTAVTNAPRQIAVQFWYEYHDASGQWFRTYGLEDWTFAADGRMAKRMMSANDVAITEEERWFKEGVDVDSVEIGEKHW
jgi:hypothetical protein